MIEMLKVIDCELTRVDHEVDGLTPKTSVCGFF